MLPALGTTGLSDTLKGLEEKHMQRAAAAIAEMRRLLELNPRPDTFLGRKTQEPLPRDEPV